MDVNSIYGRVELNFKFNNFIRVLNWIGVEMSYYHDPCVREEDCFSWIKCDRYEYGMSSFKNMNNLIN